MAKERLQKILAAAGIASRRNCEELILNGVVKVNGKVADSLPVFADPEEDTITVRGKPLQPAIKVYFILNKPKGIVCTSSDPQGRRTAVELVTPVRERIFCVGRLDIETTGALILTNDSELANRLTHPKYELPKKYVVRLKGKIDAEAVETLKKGVWLSDGKAGATAIKLLKTTHEESVLEITLKQSLNRQISRMFAKVGYKVKAVARTHIGKIEIGGLKPGEFRRLSKVEVAYLKKATEHAKTGEK
ncbi:MAG: pseudouridine synthase [Sedimentisphaerales bacterium]|nr:pseudouridine synthase [Sedimentisphaerales bacterium]